MYRSDSPHCNPTQSSSETLPAFSLQCFHRNGWNHSGVKIFNPFHSVLLPTGICGKLKKPSNCTVDVLYQGYRNFEIQIGPLDRWRHRRYTNMSSTIPNSHENSSFSSKSVSEMDYFSDTVQLQPVVSKRSRDNPKSLATDRCLIQGSINIRCGVWIHLFFQCP